MESTVLKNVRTRGKRPMRNLSVIDKIRAIQRIHDGETKASVSRDLGVPESTLRGWCKNEQKLRTMSNQSLLLDGLKPEDKLSEKPANISAEPMELSSNMTNFKSESLALETFENNAFTMPTIPMESLKNYDNVVAALGIFNWGPHFMEQSDMIPTESLSMKSELIDGANSFAYPKEDFNQIVPTKNDYIKDNLNLLEKINTSYIENNNEEGCVDNNNPNQNNNYTYMQWCSMIIGSMNFMVQASLNSDIMDTSSSSAGQECKSVISSQYANKRTYDDPFSELRNIYELNKSSDVDEPIDDSVITCDDMPQDLSIKMR